MSSIKEGLFFDKNLLDQKTKLKKTKIVKDQKIKKSYNKKENSKDIPEIKKFKDDLQNLVCELTTVNIKTDSGYVKKGLNWINYGVDYLLGTDFYNYFNNEKGNIEIDENEVKDLLKSINDFSFKNVNSKNDLNERVKGFHQECVEKFNSYLNYLENKIKNRDDKNVKLAMHEKDMCKKIDEIFEEFEKNFDIIVKNLNKENSSKVINIIKNLKLISRDLKLLKKKSSWFFQKDNCAKKLYKYLVEMYKIIKGRMMDDKNNRKENVKRIKELLGEIEKKIPESIKDRMLEKGLHNEDVDQTKMILEELYKTSSRLSNLIFSEKFKEISFDFESVTKSNPEIQKDYYIKLIKIDFKKLYKKTSFILKKDNAAKILYKELKNNFIAKLKKPESITAEEFLEEENFIKEKIEQRKEELYISKKEIDTDKDTTIKIMRNLHNDIVRLDSLVHGTEMSEIKPEEKLFQADQKTAESYKKYFKDGAPGMENKQNELDNNGNLKSRGEKIKGTVISSFYIMTENFTAFSTEGGINLASDKPGEYTPGKIIMTIEGLDLAEKFSCESGLDNTYISILCAEIDVDIDFFVKSKKVKIRAYASISTSLIYGISSKWCSTLGAKVVKWLGNLSVVNNMNVGKVHFLPYGGAKEKKEVLSKIDKEENPKDAGAALKALNNIKKNIKKMNKTYKRNSEISKICKKLNDFYEQLDKIITGTDEDDDANDEIAYQLAGTKSFIEKIERMGVSNNEKWENFLDNLSNLKKSLEEFEKHSLNFSVTLNEEGESKFLESYDKANIYGEVLTSCPFLTKTKYVKDNVVVSKKSAKKMDAKSYTTGVEKRVNPGLFILTMENASLNGWGSSVKKANMPSKGSYIACVADLRIKISFEISAEEKQEKKEKQGWVEWGMDVFVKKFAGALYNGWSKLSYWIPKLKESPLLNSVGQSLSFASIFEKGIRVRAYLSLENLAGKLTDKFVTITSRMEKGEIDLTQK